MRRFFYPNSSLLSIKASVINQNRFQKQFWMYRVMLFFLLHFSALRKQMKAQKSLFPFDWAVSLTDCLAPLHRHCALAAQLSFRPLPAQCCCLWKRVSPVLRARCLPPPPMYRRCFAKSLPHQKYLQYRAPKPLQQDFLP